MKEIQLTQGKVTLVDDGDYEWLSQWKWYADKSSEKKTPVAIRTHKTSDGKRTSILMHRVIMNITNQEIQVDHIDGNKLNNQKNNLRVCDNRHNHFNMSLYKTNTSGFKGVYWHRKAGKWVAQIYRDKKHYYLGCFDFLLEAALAYDKAAIDLFGDFAKLNFP